MAKVGNAVLDWKTRPQFNIMKTDQERFDYLNTLGYSDDVIVKPENSPTKDWAVYDKNSNIIHPVNKPGFDMGDITGAAPMIAKGLATSAGAAASIPAVVATGIPTGGLAAIPIVAGGSAIGGGLEEAAEETLAKKILGKKWGTEGYHPGEIGKQAAISAVTGIIPGSSNVVKGGWRATIGGEGAGAFEKGIIDWADVLAGRVATGAGPTTAHAFAKQHGIDNNYLAGEYLKGNIDTKALGVGNSDDFIAQSAEQVRGILKNGQREINKDFTAAVQKKLDQEGLDMPIDNIAVNMGKTSEQLRGFISKIAEKKYVPDEIKSIVDEISEKGLDKPDLSYRQALELREIISDLYQQSLSERNMRTPLSRLVGPIQKAVGADIRSNPLLTDAYELTAPHRQALDNLMDITSRKLTEFGEAKETYYPMEMKLGRMTNKFYSDRLKDMGDIQDTLNTVSGLKGVDFMTPLKTGLWGKLTEKSTKTWIPGIKSIPVVNKVAGMIPGSNLQTGTDLERRLMAPFVNKLPEEVVNAPINRVFPNIAAVANVVGGKVGIPKLGSTAMPLTRTAGVYGINKIADLFKQYRDSLPKGK
jgi:uncharacterized protein (UPF0335 family)